MFKLPPIIIFVTEEDDAVFETLLKQKDELYAIGYRHINLELNCDETKEEISKKYNAFEKKIKDMHLTTKPADEFTPELLHLHSILKNYYYCRGINHLVQTIGDDNRWNIDFIDILKGEMFNLPSYDFRISLDELKPIREIKFAQQILTSSIKHDGGSITIIGNNHYTVCDYIKRQAPDFINSALFFVFQQYYSCMVPLSAQLSAYTETKRKESYLNNLRHRKDLFNSYFPKDSFFALSITEFIQTPIMEALFVRYIKNKIEKLNLNQELNKQITDSESFKNKTLR